MYFGTSIQETRFCNFGSLYIVHIHNCDNSDPESCHADIIELGDKPAKSTRLQRIREIRGISAAKLMGNTLIIGVDSRIVATWSEIYENINAIMRSS